MEGEDGWGWGSKPSRLVTLRGPDPVQTIGPRDGDGSTTGPYPGAPTSGRPFWVPYSGQPIARTFTDWKRPQTGGEKNHPYFSLFGHPSPIKGGTPSPRYVLEVATGEGGGTGPPGVGDGRTSYRWDETRIRTSRERCSTISTNNHTGPGVRYQGSPPRNRAEES